MSYVKINFGSVKLQIFQQKEVNVKMGKKIMLVDDSKLVCMQIKQILSKTEYEVVACCTSGEDALNTYPQAQPDLIAMDIIMPGMDGLETASILKTEHPEVKIIMLSSLAYNDTFKEAERIGAEAFVSKPLDPNELLAAIETALAN